MFLIVALGISLHFVWVGGQRLETALAIAVANALDVSVPTGTGEVPTCTVAEGTFGTQFGRLAHLPTPEVVVGVHAEHFCHLEGRQGRERFCVFKNLIGC